MPPSYCQWTAATKYTTGTLTLPILVPRSACGQPSQDVLTESDDSWVCRPQGGCKLSSITSPFTGRYLVRLWSLFPLTYAERGQAVECFPAIPAGFLKPA